MQEIMKDGSEGKCFVEDTVEDLVPHIKKSLSDPNVKFVKVFKGAKIVPSKAGPPFEQRETFTAGEEKKDLIEQIIEDDKKEKRIGKKNFYDR